MDLFKMAGNETAKQIRENSIRRMREKPFHLCLQNCEVVTKNGVFIIFIDKFKETKDEWNKKLGKMGWSLYMPSEQKKAQIRMCSLLQLFKYILIQYTKENAKFAKEHMRNKKQEK